jgi:Gene product 88
VHVPSKGAARSLRHVLTIPEAEAIIGGPLGRPSKMPCPSWGISAESCTRGSRLSEQPGSVCSACYARRGRYLNPSVVAAHERRLAALSHPRWTDAMACLINAYARGGHFRWFDSGDLQSPEHLELILRVARRTPTVSHWLPTRETGIVRPRIADLPSNLTVRVSADVIGKAAGRDMGLPTSTVHREPGHPVQTARRNDSIECLAYLRGHRCGPCRACWSPKVRNVSYLLNAGLRTASRAVRYLPLVPEPYDGERSVPRTE